MKNTTTRTYGWQPQPIDERDFLFAPMPHMHLPAKVDLSIGCPPVYDQGQLGSCTANAIGAAFHFNELKENPALAIMPSRLFIYYNERAMEGSVKQDAGANIRDGIKTVNTLGICPEPEWPYDISKFAKKPVAKCFKDAKKYESVKYMAVAQTLADMKNCLAQGFPFVFGFTVYESFESDTVAKTGIVPMPAKHEKVLGGHAVMAVGYDDADQTFLVRNSWGSGWGISGYFKMPYAYLMGKLASDFWTIESVTEATGTHSAPIPQNLVKENREASHGIVIAGIGHGYNGSMALNLAISIKNNQPDVKIALLYDEPGIRHIKNRPELATYFDKLIEGPELKKDPYKETLHLEPFQIEAPGIVPPETEGVPPMYNLIPMSNSTEYDKLARWHFQKAGLKYPFTLKGKTRWLK